MTILKYEDKEITVSNPDKYLWPDLKIKKIDYIHYLIDLAPFIIKYTENRPLTVIRYPDGINGKSFFQKHLPAYAPSWIHSKDENGKKYMYLDDIPTLVWLANQGALEFHVTFNTSESPDTPHSLVFDLDPSEDQDFEDAADAALLIRDTLQELNISSFPKTSGASGIQIYIPVGNQYTYEEARIINHFFGSYFSSKHSNHFTIERTVKNRGKKIYFDYLQMWYKKTIISPYSPRAVESAAVSMPVTWDELEKGCHPSDFTLFNVKNRLETMGDLFDVLYNEKSYQNLSFILENL